MKTIALTMIVKNEARSLARCLDSVAPWVDKMIVLDTGSNDDTIAIARAHGAEVYERRWTNDFAAARNAALARSDADWNLVLDADEWLTSGGEYLQALRHDSRRAIHNIRIDSDLGSGSNTLISSHRIPRILPRGVRYKGRIHEQPAHSLPIIEASVTVRHDGYMQEQLDTKKGRNLALLENSLAARPPMTSMCTSSWASSTTSSCSTPRRYPATSAPENWYETAPLGTTTWWCGRSSACATKVVWKKP